MLQRHLEAHLVESLRHFPVVLLIGARQVGKSTLVRRITQSVWVAPYITLDDRTTLDAALRDPDGFIQGLEGPAVIDEVQRAPDLLRAIKLVVDRDRQPGRFLLTGSAHILTLQAVSETLAGRVAVHELRPFAWSEVHGSSARRLSEMFDPSVSRRLLKVRAPDDFRPMRKMVLTGGFPTPALMKADAPRRTWFESYRQTYLERDLRDIANVTHLPELGRLMVALALRTGSLLNIAELARDIGLPETTTRRHIRLLMQTFQLETLSPFSSNRFKRLVKTPKVYWTDTGMAAHLAAVRAWADLERRNLSGTFLETWVHAELRKLLSLEQELIELSFWRTQEGREVDFLLERGGEVVGIEVKSAASVRSRDLTGLNQCRDVLQKRWRLGIVLYTGLQATLIDDRTVAVPIEAFF
jgi:predicted AAA+ superfamily ATPase